MTNGKLNTLVLILSLAVSAPAFANCGDALGGGDKFPSQDAKSLRRNANISSILYIESVSDRPAYTQSSADYHASRVIIKYIQTPPNRVMPRLELARIIREIWKDFVEFKRLPKTLRVKTRVYGDDELAFNVEIPKGFPFDELQVLAEFQDFMAK